MTNGIFTQEAEVQHSVSVKFLTHLAYMAAKTFMSHRVVQLALMSLSSVHKLSHREQRKKTKTRTWGNSFTWTYCVAARAPGTDLVCHPRRVM